MVALQTSPLTKSTSHAVLVVPGHLWYLLPARKHTYHHNISLIFSFLEAVNVCRSDLNMSMSNSLPKCPLNDPRSDPRLTVSRTWSVHPRSTHANDPPGRWRISWVVPWHCGDWQQGICLRTLTSLNVLNAAFDSCEIKVSPKAVQILLHIVLPTIQIYTVPPMSSRTTLPYTCPWPSVLAWCAHPQQKTSANRFETAMQFMPLLSRHLGSCFPTCLSIWYWWLTDDWGRNSEYSLSTMLQSSHSKMKWMSSRHQLHLEIWMQSTIESRSNQYFCSFATASPIWDADSHRSASGSGRAASNKSSALTSLNIQYYPISFNLSSSCTCQSPINSRK